MKQVEERYISLLTDKVFDRLFEEAEIAKKMLTKGMDEATVMEITGLSPELIQQLKAEMMTVDQQV